MFNGAVIMGYQGIGKTTVANDIDIVIDFESSLMKYPDGTRPEKWEKIYCRQAIELAKNNKIVFISSHECVQKELSNYHAYEDSKVWVGAIAPWYSLRQKWLDNLEARYRDTGMSKDHYALINAERGFEQQIRTLSSNPSFTTIFLYNTSYDLSNILSTLCSIMNIDISI